MTLIFLKIGENIINKLFCISNILTGSEDRLYDTWGKHRTIRKSNGDIVGTEEFDE